MDELLKAINDTIGASDGSKVSLSFYSDGTVSFYIYEQEIPIVLCKKDKSAYLDLDLSSGKLTGDMLQELAVVTKLINKNIDDVLSCC